MRYWLTHIPADVRLEEELDASGEESSSAFLFEAGVRASLCTKEYEDVVAPQGSARAWRIAEEKGWLRDEAEQLRIAAAKEPAYMKDYVRRSQDWARWNACQLGGLETPEPVQKPPAKKQRTGRKSYSAPRRRAAVRAPAVTQAEPVCIVPAVEEELPRRSVGHARYRKELRRRPPIVE